MKKAVNGTTENSKLFNGGINMYSALQIAKWFLAENRMRMMEGDSEYLTHLKLQKLLYYAQGCYLALKDKPLFCEDILAWQHGPVVNEVYNVYKENGAKPIVFEDDYNIHEIDDETQAVLKEVFDVFGQYSAWKLREMTHSETPWKTTPQSEVINVDKIQKYFKEEYVE